MPEAAPIQQFIDKTIADNRRDFHDVAPFSVVAQENKAGMIKTRKVFDAKTGQMITTGSRANSCHMFYKQAL
jgi:hypothetical protein